MPYWVRFHASVPLDVFQKVFHISKFSEAEVDSEKTKCLLSLGLSAIVAQFKTKGKTVGG